MNIKDIPSQRIGIVYTVTCFVSWGLLPIFWKQFLSISPFEIVAQRIFWSFVFSGVIIVLWKKWTLLKNIFSSPKKIIIAVLCSLIIAANWLIYVYAINTNQIVEASMGYYINPIFSIFLGVLVLKERLNIFQSGAVVLAAAGVIYMALDFGHLPWIALMLALTFGIYGLVKKMLKLDAIAGLNSDTMFLAPFALVYIIYCHSSGEVSTIPLTWMNSLLLICTGPVTLFPLFCFAQGANRIELSSIGFIQFLAPTIKLIIGVFLYNEPFTSTHIISFSCIWAALGIYTAGSIFYIRKNRRQNPEIINF